MNQSVHSFIKGCLTLKLSLSWKMVICSSLDGLVVPFSLALSPCSPFWPWAPAPSTAGEMGMVSRGTCMSALTGVGSVSVAMIVCLKLKRKNAAGPTQGYLLKVR